jgi:hypothetical protein
MGKRSMPFIEHRHCRIAHLVAGAALIVLCRCSTDSSNAFESGAGSLTCGEPSCCAPIVVDPTRVYVYRTSDSADVRVGMVLSFAARPSSWWDMNVEVVFSSGVSVSCGSGSLFPAPDYNTVTIICPPVALDSLPACDSTITLELRPHSSTYPDSSGAQPLCVGTEGHQVKLTVPVACQDGCGYPSNGGSCNVLGETCDYSALAQGGAGGNSYVSLPCSCQWNEILNGLAWSCAVP